MGKKTRRQVSETDRGFVSCVSCFYCDEVSFEAADTQAYEAHLKTAHNISKNVDVLLDLTKQLQGAEFLEVKVDSPTRDPPEPIRLPNVEKETIKPKVTEAVLPKAEPEPMEAVPQGERKNTFADIVKNKARAVELKQSKPFENPPLVREEQAANLNLTESVSTETIKADTVKEENASETSEVVVDKKSNKNKKNQKAVTNDKTAANESEDVADANKEDGKKKNKKGAKGAEASETVEVVELESTTEVLKDDGKKKNKKGAKAAEATGKVEGVEQETSTTDTKKEETKKKKKKQDSESAKQENSEAKEPENPPPKELKGEAKKKSKKEETKEVEQTKEAEETVEPKQENKKKNKKKENAVPSEVKSKTDVNSNEKKEEGSKNNNKRVGSKDKTFLKDTVESVGGAASGVVEKEAMKEVDNILDEWFKGGREDVDDDDIPDDLPDIDDKPVQVKETVKEKPKKETIKVKDTKPEPKKTIEQTKVDAKPAKVELKTETVPPKAKTKVEEIKEEVPAERTDLDEVNDILEEWFANEEDEEEERITEITDEEVVDDSPVQQEPEKEAVVQELLPERDEVPCGDCAICSRIAKAACSGCKHVFYCTREHQKKDWSIHKENCKEFGKLPYRVERSPLLGRFLAANKDIKEGELILQESPMVIGPRQMTKPVCLGCHKEIQSAADMIKCIRCNWPVCSTKCQDSPQHDPECRATQAAGSRVKVEVFNQTNMMYACITVLRALALHDGPKKIWEDYTRFDSHLTERIKTLVYSKVNKEKVAFFILHYLGIKRYSDLEILEACGKLDTNCFELRQNGLNLRAMYRTACIISHECSPNTRHTFAPDNSINIYATRNIAKGDIISATYTNSLWSTTRRRDHLKMSKCFWCSCRRCRDPTELGSYLSAVRCSRCKGFRDNIQYDDMQYLMPTNTLDAESVWRCSKCTNIQKAAQIKSGTENMMSELNLVSRGNAESLLQFLHKNEPLLGPNNHIVVEVKYTLVSMLGNRKPYLLSDLSMELLQIKERFCRELLNVADKIEPGCSRWRGQLLLELQMAIVALAAGQAENGFISKAKAREMAEEGLKTLHVAAAILQVEPDMKETLQERLGAVSELLAQWDE